MPFKKNLSFFIVAAAVILPSVCQGYPSWRIIESAHFTAYYQRTPEKFVHDTLESAERHLKRLTVTLGWGDANMWTDESKARIMLYDSKQEFLANTGVPAWSDATSIQRERTIISYYGASKFSDKTLPHELSHILIRVYMGIDNRAVPFWLDEGFASMQEGPDTESLKGRLRELMADGKLPSAEDMTKVNISTLSKEDADVFFTASTGLVAFLMKRPGFTVFCRSLRDDRNLVIALKKGYGFEGLANLDQQWQRNIALTKNKKIKETGKIGEE